MTHILMGGLPAELTLWLSERLGGVSVRMAKSGKEILEELGRSEVSLLILDHGVSDPPATEVLSQARTTLSPEKLPVVYCLNEDVGSDLLKRLGAQLDVSQVLLHPLDPDELARQVAAILGLPRLPAGAGEGAEGLAPTLGACHAPLPTERQIMKGVAGVWDRFAATTIERLEALEQAGVALLEGTLNPELRQRAEREAHKLAGSVGTFGFAAGSKFARELEHMLQGGVLLSTTQALRFSELVVALRLELERAPVVSSTEPDSADKRRSLLILDKDTDLAERLGVEAASRGMRVETATDLSGARKAIAVAPPDVVLLDFCFSECPEDGLNLLRELSLRIPPVPVMVLTARDSFTDRVEVARRGGRGFLSKALSPSQILEAVSQLLHRLRSAEAKVMAVDDDPQVLSTLRSLLEPRGVRLATLDEPLRFWEVFEEFSPDLLLLDVEMPHLSGIELCRVIRDDARWGGEPVIFLTAHTDPETVHSVFVAGADDFVTKPIIGPELLMRLFNRLERSQLQRSMAESDPLTGVANRRKSAGVLEQFLRLAERHSQPCCVAVLNLDHLKRVNDQYGHAAGDVALRRLGQLLEQAFKSDDVVGRWGGEDFVIGMYGFSRYDGVQRLAELLERLRQERFSGTADAQFRMTFSAGVAEYPEDGADLQALYRAAAETLRQAKAAGRDRVLPVGWSPEQSAKLKSVDVALVMGDEAEACLVLHYLGTRGYRARWLKDGKEAAKALGGSGSSLRAKVVVLDVDVPRLDGLELLKRLAWEGILQRSRVIMLTAPSVNDEVTAALKLGAFDHVAKPFSLPVLGQHIRRALEKKMKSEV